MKNRSKELLTILKKRYIIEGYFNDGACSSEFRCKNDKLYVKELLSLGLIVRRNCILEMYQLPRKTMLELINQNNLIQKWGNHIKTHNWSIQKIMNEELKENNV